MKLYTTLLTLSVFFTSSTAIAWNPSRGDWKWNGKTEVKKYHYCVMIQKDNRQECYNCTSKGIGGEAGKAYCANSKGSSGDGGTVKYGVCESEANKNKCQYFGDKGEYNYSYKK